MKGILNNCRSSKACPERSRGAMGVSYEEGQNRWAVCWRLGASCTCFSLTRLSRLWEPIQRQPCIRQHIRSGQDLCSLSDTAVCISEHWGDPGTGQEEKRQAPQAGRAHLGAYQAQHPTHGHTPDSAHR